LSGLSDDQQELRDNLNGIMLAADRSAELITQLLAFARKAKYKSVPVDIHELIKEVVSMLDRSIDKKIEIECDFKADVAMVVGDPAQLQNAILNLAINARDAMLEGGVIIFSTEVVTVTELDTDFILGDVNLGKYLRLTVTDTGAGMSKEVKDRIFEPFFTTKKTGKGTGMGLPAVYGTIKNHGGNISVYSEEGRGASFVISLPLSENKFDNSAQVVDGLVDSLNDKRILVVDDEDVVCKMVERMVEKCGGTSVICSNGLEAVEYYRQYYNVIDAVVLDMIMPHKDGAETFYELRKINPKVSVVITSGFSINDNVQGLLNTGAKGFIQKPFRINELCAKIADACK
jgi:CheY-like chemotaxis protein